MTIQSKTASTEFLRRRHAWAAACMLTVPALCNAQPAGEIASAVRECQRIEGMSARLACYDRAFPPGDTAPADGDMAAAEAAAPPARAAERPAARPADRVESAAAAPAAESTDAGTSGDTTVSIVQVRVLRPRETIFYAEDGRSFMQTGGPARLRLPEPPFDVALESGAFGATFLRLPEDGPRIRVAVRE